RPRVVQQHALQAEHLLRREVVRRTPDGLLQRLPAGLDQLARGLALPRAVRLAGRTGEVGLVGVALRGGAALLREDVAGGRPALLARLPARRGAEVGRLLPAAQLLAVLADHFADVVEAFAEELPDALHEHLSAIHGVSP